MKSLPLILLSLTLAVGGQVFLKLGVAGQGRLGLEHVTQPAELARVMVSPLILLGLAFYATSAVAWVMVLSRVELNFAYPFLGLTYVAMLFITKFGFGEAVPAIRWVGTVLIVTGVVISAR